MGSLLFKDSISRLWFYNFCLLILYLLFWFSVQSFEGNSSDLLISTPKRTDGLQRSNSAEDVTPTNKKVGFIEKKNIYIYIYFLIIHRPRAIA